MERDAGIEPAAHAWEAWVIPLYDARSGRPILRAAGKPQQMLHEPVPLMLILYALQLCEMGA